MSKAKGDAGLVGPGQAAAEQPASAVASKLRDAIALHQQGRIEQAEAAYREILQLEPRHFEALHMLGLAAFQKGELQTGIDLVGKAIEIDPDQPSAHVNMGNALRLLKRPQDALASYDRALQLSPDSIDALYNRSNILLELNRPAEALAGADHTLRLEPDHFGALNSRGRALRYMNRLEDALAAYDMALQRKPDYAIALYNRGNVLRELKRLDEALASYDRALQFKPADANTLTNRGTTLVELKRMKEAAACFAKLLEVAPGYDYALGNFFYCQLSCCDWTQFAQTSDRLVRSVEAGERASMPFAFLAISDSPSANLRCASTFAHDKYPRVHPPLWTGQRYSHDQIRVAYLSADFRDHAIAYLTAELFERHDTRRFDITAVSFGPDGEDEMRVRLRRAFGRFLEVRTRSDREVAQLMRDLEIDIAVDLTGYTADCRTGILAHRPAPIQVNYLGYPGTMGVDYIDYVLADAVVIPLGQQIHYTEKVVYLPDCYQANDSKRRIATRTPRRDEVGLPEEGFVFCCFNNNHKIAPYIFDIWMRLLDKVQGSVLWLFEGGPTVSDNLRQAAAQRGVAPERLVFAPRMPPDRHLARHRLADLFLDTLPYNAHTTASDALWAGLPVLTCMGNAFAGRVAASLLHAVGMPEMITSSLAEYEALALKLASTPEMLAAIRAKLARDPAALPLFDADRFRRHIESAFTTMWERQQRGQLPEGFSVPLASPSA